MRQQGFWRGGRVAECGGLENRFPPSGGTWVQIPASPSFLPQAQIFQPQWEKDLRNSRKETTDTWRGSARAGVRSFVRSAAENKVVI